MSDSLLDLCSPPLVSEIGIASYPSWSAATLKTRGPLTAEMIRRGFDAIRDYTPQPEYIVFPSPVRGTSQRDRRRRTLWVNGVRIELPEGSIPLKFLYAYSSGWTVDDAMAVARHG